MRKAILSLAGDVEDPINREEIPQTSTNQEGGVKHSIADGIVEKDLSEDEVTKVEVLMRKLQATREAGKDMSQEQRRGMAARSMEKAMRELWCGFTEGRSPRQDRGMKVGLFRGLVYRTREGMVGHATLHQTGKFYFVSQHLARQGGYSTSAKKVKSNGEST